MAPSASTATNRERGVRPPRKLVEGTIPVRVWPRLQVSSFAYDATRRRFPRRYDPGPTPCTRVNAFMKAAAFA